MGARGPTKKPAELEELHGNPGHRKTENRLQFSKPEKVPSPPVFLNKIAKRVETISTDCIQCRNADGCRCRNICRILRFICTVGIS